MNIFIETSVSCINGAWELIKFDLPIIRLNESNKHDEIKAALKTNKADFGLLDSNNIIVTVSPRNYITISLKFVILK